MKMLAPENQAESTNQIIKEGTKGAIADQLFTDAYGPIKNQQNNSSEAATIKGVKGCVPQAGATVIFDDIYSSTVKPDKYPVKPGVLDDAYDTGKPIKKPQTDGGIKDQVNSQSNTEKPIKKPQTDGGVKVFEK